MNSTLGTKVWARLLLILGLLLPLVILFLLPGGPLVRGGPWFWLLLLSSFFAIWGLLAPSRRAAEKTAEPEIQMLPPDKQLAAVREVINVRLATEEAGVRTFHGPAVTGPLRVARTAHVGDHRVLYRRPTHTAAQRPDSVNRWPPLAGLFDP